MKVFKTHEWEHAKTAEWRNLKVSIFVCVHCETEKRISKGRYIFYFRPGSVYPERKPSLCNHRELCQQDS